MARSIPWPHFVMAFFIASCTTTKVPELATERPNLSTRELSSAEKQALTHSLSRTLKDPESAKFQFGPVKYAAGSQTTEYCGLVNGKNSYGGYKGYQMFHAVLKLDAKGQYSSGEIDYINVANATGDQLLENVNKLDAPCVAAGYGKLSLVPQ